jgi:HNH endonuclease
MSIEVVRTHQIVDGDVPGTKDVLEIRRLFNRRGGSPVSVLLNLREHPWQKGPVFNNIEITLSEKGKIATVHLPLEWFLSADEYKMSFDSPLCFEKLEAKRRVTTEPQTVDESRVWLFRDAIYFAARAPRGPEVEEMILRIKALHFREDESLKRLREQVANFEAIEANSKATNSRRAIPDDVKLLVWSRDGGACVKCGAKTDLHFDHIIPLSRGGGDHAQNIQLLCRTCNLTKSDHIA